jgi:6,7-dimethyl-8-ribityllumazine synthase
MPDRPIIPAVAVIVSRYNASVTDRLLEGALTEYRARGGVEGAADVFPAPGAFELPALCAAAAKSGRYGAIVALGCVIKGETIHDRVLADAVARGLTEISVSTGVPVGLGLLTVDTPEQAMARAGGTQGNKGREAMAAAIEAALTIAMIRAGTASAWRPGPEERRLDKTGRCT